mgnify:CR=1 FL=1
MTILGGWKRNSIRSIGFRRSCLPQNVSAHFPVKQKVLYGLLLDRMGLSIKNRWFDEEDRVYIIFTVEELAELLKLWNSERLCVF